MSQLIQHIAGIPTATEQRCVRCCKVIRRYHNYTNKPTTVGTFPLWPGLLVVMLDRYDAKPQYATPAAVDCTPVDLCARETSGGPLGGSR
jgi:hypothetical protein